MTKVSSVQLRMLHIIHRYRHFQRAKGIWKSVRLSVEPALPECPEDTSEPQWADLLCSTTCSVRERLLSLWTSETLT